MEFFRKVAAAMGGTAPTPGYLAGVPELRAFTDAGLAADPPTAGLSEETFAIDAQQHLADVALDLASERWHAAEAGDAAVSEHFGVHATYEVLAATAACAAHEDTGRIVVGMGEAREGVRRVCAHAEGAGLGAVVRVYATVATFDDLQAISFYQPMPERAYATGAWHRPWTSHSLEDELLMAAAAGLVRVRRRAADGRQIRLTPDGQRVLAEVAARLEAAGVLAERRRLLAVAHRNAVAHQTALHGAPAQSGPQAWAEVLAAAGVREGSRILLCGLAIGGEALVREVADIVGPTGAVHVVDPAAAVLRVMTHRAAEPLPPHVRLTPARFDALPLSDAAVDACLAPAFLHLGTDTRALAEIRRVLRPGGRLALAVPHAVDTGHALVREWLEPLLEMAARLEVPEAPRGGIPGEAGDALARLGFVDIQARPHPVTVAFHPKGALVHLLHGGGPGAGVLERMPWRERHNLLRDLGSRGEHLWAAAGQRGLITPGELIVATVP